MQRDPPAYVDGGNLYEYVGSNPVNYVDPSGLIGIFFDGAGQQWGNNTTIEQLARDYRDPAFYYATRMWPNNIRANIRQAHTRVCEAFCNCMAEYCTEEPVDIFGWSRGGVASLELADRLNTQGCDCNGATFQPIKVRFVGVIDVVSTGGAQMLWLNHDTVPDNVVFARHLRRDGNYDNLDRTVFRRTNVTAANPAVTNYAQPEYPVAHRRTGFHLQIRIDLRAAATAAGAPL